MVIKRLCVLVAAVSIGIALGFYCGAKRPLGDLEKRNIAIDYACNPAQNWRMMKLFCGSLPAGEKPK